MDEYFIEQLKRLRCGPCKNDRGIEKLPHVMWFLTEHEQKDEIVVLPLCLECAKMVFSRSTSPSIDRIRAPLTISLHVRTNHADTAEPRIDSGGAQR
jgi:hypothetical protein